MIYLIHFDKPVGRTQHYLGVCRDDRLQLRLTEHARGYGAVLTSQAIKRGAKLWLARTFPGSSRELEATMKRHGHYRLMCPLCCPLFANLRKTCFEIDPKRPDEPPAAAILDWDPRRR